MSSLADSFLSFFDFLLFSSFSPDSSVFASVATSLPFLLFFSFFSDFSATGADSGSFAFLDFLSFLDDFEESPVVEGPAAGVVGSAGVLFDFFEAVS